MSRGPRPRLRETKRQRPSRNPGGPNRGKPASVHIDFDKIGQRIIAVNVPAADYSNLMAGAAGTIFYTEPMSGNPGAPLRLQRYQLKERAAAPFLEGIRSYTLSGDKKKLLYQAAGGGGGGAAAGGRERWGIVATDRPAKIGDGALQLDQLQMEVDPRAEWKEIYRESWRIEREYFYDPKMHGADWQAIYDKYLPLLRYVGHRVDLGYVIAMMGGELTVGHSYLQGEGDVPGQENPVPVGLLGADYKLKTAITASVTFIPARIGTPICAHRSAHRASKFQKEIICWK